MSLCSGVNVDIIVIVLKLVLSISFYRAVSLCMSENKVLYTKHTIVLFNCTVHFVNSSQKMSVHCGVRAAQNCTIPF